MGALSCLRLFKGAHCKIYPETGYPSLVPLFLAWTNCSSLLIGCSSILTELRFVLYKTANITSKDPSWNYMNSSPQTLRRLPILLSDVILLHSMTFPSFLLFYSHLPLLPFVHSVSTSSASLLYFNILSLLQPQVLQISILFTWNILPLVIYPYSFCLKTFRTLIKIHLVKENLLKHLEFPE